MGNNNPRSFDCSVVSWDEVHKLTHDIVDKIKKTDFEPSAVVGVSRGGWTPARNTADLLRIDNLTSMKIDHYQGTSKTEDADIVFNVREEAIANERVLVVDDIVDTGKSLKRAREDVERRNVEQVRTSTVHELPSSDVTPDYVGNSLDEFVWVIYPWNVAEDLEELIENVVDDEGWSTTQQIDRQLMKYHNINIEMFEETFDLRFEELIDTIASTGDIELDNNGRVRI